MDKQLLVNNIIELLKSCEDVELLQLIYALLAQSLTS